MYKVLVPYKNSNLHNYTFKSHVRTESRYGTKTDFFDFPEAAWSAKAEITKPKVCNDLNKGKCHIITVEFQFCTVTTVMKCYMLLKLA